MANDTNRRSLRIHGVKGPLVESRRLVDSAYAELIQASSRKSARIELAADRSAEAEDHRLSCQAEDLVELQLEGGLRLYTSVERLMNELIPSAETRSDDHRELVIPRRIHLADRRSRGLGEILVEAVELFDLKGKIVEQLGAQAGEGTAKAVTGWLEDKLVGEGGLYSVEQIRAVENSGSTPTQAAPEEFDGSKPVLLFIHGTASSTQGSFGDLWSREIDDFWPELTRSYGGNIFGFEHRTLTQSPIKNALDLVNSLPRGCRLHLISHSRGGLVGELICRGQFTQGRAAFSPDELALFEPRDNAYLARLVHQKLIDIGDYAQHRADLAALNQALREADLKVDRFIRVACPARGTTLASGKLDLYLSALLNILGLLPAVRTSSLYAFLQALVLTVAKQRTRPEALPGLEAQMPGSPFIAMLNGARETTEAHLAVISGDIEPRGVFKKIALLLVDRFYESDHDLVVNTPSMDGGAQRIGTIPVLPCQGGDVHHFSYFTKSESRHGLAAALKVADRPPGFEFQQQQTATKIARSLPRGRSPGNLPGLLFLPGISGSHLQVNGNRVWIDPFDLMHGKFAQLEIDAEGISEDGMVASAYGAMARFLGDSHLVVPFPYDWRQSILTTADRLAAVVEEQLRNSRQPLRILAHSMGGLVVRGLMAKHPAVWQRLCQRPGAHVVMLGTPNSGSHAIPRLFALQDKLIKWLAIADLQHDQYQLLDLIRQFPGMLELLPTGEQGRYFEPGIWNQFDRLLARAWRKPTQRALRAAHRVSTTLTAVELDPAHVFYIAGRADETPIDLTIEDDRIRFFSTRRGDGRVPWDGGIPAGIRHWFIDAPHGDLANHQAAFEGILQILEQGECSLLSSRPPIDRGSPDLRTEMPEDRVEIHPDTSALAAAALGSPPFAATRPGSALPPVKLSVRHGDLCFVDAPILVSHYQDDTIVSAEAQIDREMDGRLQELYRLGLYPGALDSSEVLLNELEESRFPGTVIVGLGRVGELSAGALRRTYRAALLRYADTLRRHRTYREQPIRLVSLLIGTGSGGISLHEAISAMLHALLEANRLLSGPSGNSDRMIASLEFIELYQDVAVKALRHLRSIADGHQFEQTVAVEPLLQTKQGGRTRVFYDEDTAWWQRLRIACTDEGSLEFTALTQRARAVSRTQPTQRRSVEPFLHASTRDSSIDVQAGRVLFELLIPQDFKPFAQDNRNLLLVLDESAAAYPWELLTYREGKSTQALALRAGVIRQLITRHERRGELCMNGRALVVGDPRYGSPDFPQLPGARQEARAVAGLLTAGFGPTLLLDNPSGAEILSRLMAGEFQLLHLAGHGVYCHQLPAAPTPTDDCSGSPTQPDSKVSGMVIGPDHILTPVEIAQMPRTPEFVFINCCHLGKTTAGQAAMVDQPHRLAASLAAQLILQGVRAVIAAGWAVDDAAAATFAQGFYRNLLAGECFGDAVHAARVLTAHQHPASNTWGAYQCYGDHGYRLRRQAAGGGEQKPPMRVSLAEYLVDIRNLVATAKPSLAGRSGLGSQLDQIQRDIPQQWANQPELLAALAAARAELGQVPGTTDTPEPAPPVRVEMITAGAAKTRAGESVEPALELADGVASSLLHSILTHPDDNRAEWQDDLTRFLDGDAELTRQSVGEAAIIAVQRLMVFLGYSTASSGACLIDGDFGRGTNRGVAQFQLEHGSAPSIRRDLLCYPCRWNTASRLITAIPDTRLDPDSLRRMANLALARCSTGQVMAGAVDDSVFHLNALHKRRYLGCREILERYGDAVSAALLSLEEEQPVRLRPEWLLALIRQESAGVIRPRFEQHYLSRLNRKYPDTPFEELRLRAMSLGLGQIMGDNFSRVGATSAGAMFAAPVPQQIGFMARFLLPKRRELAKANPQARDFRAVAHYYNGPAYAAHHYHEAIERWFKEFQRLM